MRAINTSMNDFLTTWDDVQHAWSYLSVPFFSLEGHKMSLKTINCFSEAQREFVVILDLMNRYQRIDLLMVNEPDLHERAVAIETDFSKCRADLEDWLLQRKYECPRLLNLHDHELVNFYLRWMTSKTARVAGAVDMYISKLFEHVKRIDHSDDKTLVLGLTSHAEVESIKFFNKMPTLGALVVWIQNLETRIKNTLSANVKHCLARRPAVAAVTKKWLRKQPKSQATKNPTSEMFTAGCSVNISNSHVNEHIAKLAEIQDKTSKIKFQVLQPQWEKKKFENANTEIWLIDDSQNVPIQSALLASSIDYTEKVETAFVDRGDQSSLNKPKNVLNARRKSDVFFIMKDFNVKLKMTLDNIIHRLHSLVAVHVVAKSSQRHLSALSSLLSTQLMHQRDTTQHLISSKVSAIDSINWEFLPRQYLVSNHTKSDVIVKIGKWEFPYGFEYQGAFARLGLTHFGEKSLFKLAYAMKNHFGSRVHVDESDNRNVDITKALHFSCLANILGRQLQSIHCNEHTHTETIVNKLISVINCGSVCAVMSADKMSEKVTANVCGIINSIREAWYNPLSGSGINIPGTPCHIQLKAKSSWLQFGFPFFITSEDSKYPAALSLRLLSMFRNVAISIPSLNILLDSCLLSSGFISCDRLSPVLMEAVIEVSTQLPNEVGPIQYTTIAGSVSSASKLLDYIRHRKNNAVMELLQESVEESCVWVEQNDEEEARALRNSLVQHIFQQVCNKPDAQDVRGRVEIIVNEVFARFANDANNDGHGNDDGDGDGDGDGCIDDETKNNGDNCFNHNATEEDNEKGRLIREKGLESCKKIRITPSQSMLDAIVDLYTQLENGSGTVTVVCGASGCGKSVVWKAVLHMLSGDSELLKSKNVAIEKANMLNTSAAVRASLELTSLLGDKEKNALRILQKNVRGFIQQKRLGAVMLFSDKHTKKLTNSPIHLEYLRVGSLTKANMLGFLDSETNTWWDGLLLRRLRQLTLVSAANHINEKVWRSLVVLDGLEGEVRYCFFCSCTSQQHEIN